ncbi:MAG: PEP-CTERM sorting domain-containing protein [Planctomycetia bacterium]|nr:PEP-CTERM sorting domain-containing protein [Planctomycetia bacterium]
MNRSLLGLMTIVGALLLAPQAAVAEPGLLFDQSIYQVAPGESFDVQVLIDGDVATAAADAVANGLVSYGWQFDFDGAKASVDGLVVPAELNYFAFAAGASITSGPGLAGAEGNIDQVTFTPYQDSLLATVTLKNLALAPDSYDLTLSLAPHFPTEQLFVDGQGNVLDDTIVLGTAKVLVAVPEPGTITLAGIGVCIAATCRARLGRNSRRCARSS